MFTEIYLFWFEFEEFFSKGFLLFLQYYNSWLFLPKTRCDLVYAENFCKKYAE